MVRSTAEKPESSGVEASSTTCRSSRTEPAFHVVSRRPVMTLDQALHRIERLLGAQIEWARLEAFLPETEDPEFRKSALASSFLAALELARLGKVELDQESAFAPLFVRAA